MTDFRSDVQEVVLKFEKLVNPYSKGYSGFWYMKDGKEIIFRLVLDREPYSQYDRPICVLGTLKEYLEISEIFPHYLNYDSDAKYVYRSYISLLKKYNEIIKDLGVSL